MSQPVGEERWAALRALRENQVPVTIDLLACAAGRTPEEVAVALERWPETAEGMKPSQVNAMKQLLGGRGPTFGLVAAVGRLTLYTVINHASVNGWTKPNIPHWRRRDRDRMEKEAGTESIGQTAGVAAVIRLDSVRKRKKRDDGLSRAERVSAMLLTHADALIAQAEEQGGALTKPQLDTMLAMVRLAEKFEPLARQEAGQKQKKTAAEIAAIYERVEKRIEQLARRYARELVARGEVK